MVIVPGSYPEVPDSISDVAIKNLPVYSENEQDNSARPNVFFDRKVGTWERDSK